MTMDFCVVMMHARKAMNDLSLQFQEKPHVFLELFGLFLLYVISPKLFRLLMSPVVICTVVFLSLLLGSGKKQQGNKGTRIKQVIQSKDQDSCVKESDNLVAEILLDGVLKHKQTVCSSKMSQIHAEKQEEDHREKEDGNKSSEQKGGERKLIRKKSVRFSEEETVIHLPEPVSPCFSTSSSSDNENPEFSLLFQENDPSCYSRIDQLSQDDNEQNVRVSSPDDESDSEEEDSDVKFQRKVRLDDFISHHTLQSVLLKPSVSLYSNDSLSDISECPEDEEDKSSVTSLGDIGPLVYEVDSPASSNNGDTGFGEDHKVNYEEMLSSNNGDSGFGEDHRVNYEEILSSNNGDSGFGEDHKVNYEEMLHQEDNLIEIALSHEPHGVQSLVKKDRRLVKANVIRMSEMEVDANEEGLIEIDLTAHS